MTTDWVMSGIVFVAIENLYMKCLSILLSPYLMHFRASEWSALSFGPRIGLDMVLRASKEFIEYWN